MQFRSLTGAALLTIVSALTYSLQAQTVQVRNDSYPGTALEVGNTVGVYISGGTYNQEVTVVANGGSPFVYGNLDMTGAWSHQSLIISGGGTSNQTWYLDGTPITPNNLSTTYFPKAPKLPGVLVYNNYVGSNCPGALSGAYCGSGSAAHWNYTPVAYCSTSTLLTSGNVNSDVSTWNSMSSNIQMSSNSYCPIWIHNGSAGTDNGITRATSGTCTSCAGGYKDLCSIVSPFECIGGSGVYGAEIILDATNLAGAASAQGVSVATVATNTVMHELGHALRLADIGVGDGKCSEVQSVMYGSLSVLRGCGVTAPTSCDSNELNVIYPTAPATCSAVGTNYCSSTTC